MKINPAKYIHPCLISETFRREDSAGSLDLAVVPLSETENALNLHGNEELDDALATGRVAAKRNKNGRQSRGYWIQLGNGSSGQSGVRDYIISGDLECISSVKNIYPRSKVPLITPSNEASILQVGERLDTLLCKKVFIDSDQKNNDSQSPSPQDVWRAAVDLARNTGSKAPVKLLKTSWRPCVTVGYVTHAKWHRDILNSLDKMGLIDSHASLSESESVLFVIYVIEEDGKSITPYLIPQILGAVTYFWGVLISSCNSRCLHLVLSGWSSRWLSN